MRSNRYTKAVDEIKTPERAVEKALKTAKYFEEKEKVISMKKWIKGTIAASLAVAVTAGSLIGFNLFGGKTEKSFVMTVNAAEIKSGKPADLSVGDGGMSVVYNDGDLEYCVNLPFEIKGEHIKTVTYSVEKDAIAVACRKDNNPVIKGNVVGESIDTLFDVDYIKEDQKALDEAMEHDNPNNLESPEAEEIMNRYEGKKYSSITLAYNNQNPDGCRIGIVGKRENESEANQSESLDEKANRLEKIIKNTVRCTVTFDDGSEQAQTVKIGTTVTDFGTAHAEWFNELTEGEKVMKDYKDVFVRYSTEE